MPSKTTVRVIKRSQRGVEAPLTEGRKRGVEISQDASREVAARVSTWVTEYQQQREQQSARRSFDQLFAEAA